MSLINDALKRVKEAQHKAPPSAELGPQLRPVEPVAIPAHHGLGWLLPIGLVGVALLTLLLLWELARRENPAVAVRAETAVQSSLANDTFQNSVRSVEPARSADTSPDDASTVATTHSTGAIATAPSNSLNSSPPTNALSVQANTLPVSEPEGNTNSVASQPPETSGQAG